MMIRILSILPMLVGLLSALILVLSIIGYQAPAAGNEVPIVPCSNGDSGCNVGMTVDDMEVPKAFGLLDITLDVEWNEPERGWLGVVDSSAAEECPPDRSTGLTMCTKDEIEEFLVAGGPQNDGSMSFKVKPGSYRFVTAGYEGAGLDSQLVEMSSSIHLDNVVELILAGTSGLLLLGAGEMAFPIRNLINRIRG
jgi:hypothetical protein|tara:strand:- start:1144 stop:1728 length:585 start_codon:yes stop_codon:yes gene_type:complete